MEQDVPAQIQQALRAGELDTLQIAKAVFGSRATQRRVNAYLYRMEREGLLVRRIEPGQTRPRWRNTE